jgi:hypothetical protein
MHTVRERTPALQLEIYCCGDPMLMLMLMLMLTCQ